MACGLLIADSGPLIAITRLDLLPGLCGLFSEVWIPGVVLAEVTRDMQRPDAKALSAAVSQGLLKQVDPSTEEVNTVLRFGLDPGETEAIALAASRQAMLLIDERKGRLAAQSLGLEMIGTVGVLIALRRSQAIPHVTPYFQRLDDMGYFLSETLIRETLKLLDEA